MADEGDRSGSDGGGAEAPGQSVLLPAQLTAGQLMSGPIPYPPIYGQPYPYPAHALPPMYLPAAPAVDKSEVKFCDAVPAQVRAEVNWLIKTAKQNRMPIGVLVTCHRLLLVILQDLEDVHRPPRRIWRTTALDRLSALRKVGAVTKAVVEEAALIQLEPTHRPEATGALMGDPQDASRYVAFLRLLVDIAYEARAKYRKAQQPAAKTAAQGVSVSVTYGPPTTGGGS
jgi:hypothetical protein